MSELTRDVLMGNLFGTGSTVKNDKADENTTSSLQIVEISPDDIRSYGGSGRVHRFRLNEEKVEDIASSIDVIGRIITPCFVRKDPDGIKKYEMLAGHHRQAAAIKKELDTIPCIILEVENDVEANAITAITNVQRESLSIMEKAYLYRYEYDYIKHQGKKIDGQWAIEQVAEKSENSARTVRRHIQLTYLVEDLQEMIIDKSLPIVAGEELSTLPEDIQQIICDVARLRNCSISMMVTQKLKERAAHHILDEKEIIEIFSDCEIAPSEKRFKLTMPKYAEEYFPKECDTASKREDLILKLLIAYRNDPAAFDDDDEGEGNE